MALGDLRSALHELIQKSHGVLSPEESLQERLGATEKLQRVLGRYGNLGSAETDSVSSTINIMQKLVDVSVA